MNNVKTTPKKYLFSHICNKTEINRIKPTNQHKLYHAIQSYKS